MSNAEKQKQKDPKDRAHIWEHESKVATPDPEPEAAPPSDYPLQIPRYLHKPFGATLKVDTVAACKAALKDGWTVQPV